MTNSGKSNYENCKNFLDDKLCDPFVIKTFIWEEVSPSKSLFPVTDKDIEKVKEICSMCKNFTRKE